MRLLSENILCNFCFILFITFLSLPLFAENVSDTLDKSKKLTVLPVPAFGYAPETKAYVGAVCLFNWHFGNDTVTRPSNAKAEVNYTQRKQFINELGWNIFFRKEKYLTNGRINFSKFPDYYWGQGNNSKENNKVGYSSLRTLAELFFLKQIQQQWFIGPAFRYVKFTDLIYQNGTTSTYNDLAPHEAIGFPGITIIRDTRNRILLPEKGMYFLLQPVYMFQKSTPYFRITMDARKYFACGKKQVFSTQFRWVYSSCKNPLDQAVFGGDGVARGFYAGRYRSPLYVTLQQEWKYTIYRRWGIAFFGGISAIGNDANRWNTENVKYNFGSGLRFLIDRKEHINLRLDYALASGKQRGFYVVFGEAF